MRNFMILFLTSIFCFFLIFSGNKPPVEIKQQKTALIKKIPIEEKKEKTVKQPNFLKIDIFQQRSNEKSIYADVVNHAENHRFGRGEAYNRSTVVHESTHDINSTIRNKKAIETGKKYNGFYVLNNRGVTLEEPNLPKLSVNKYIPSFLKTTGRYDLYAAHDNWNDHALYIFDEWIAYTNDDLSTIEDDENNRIDKQKPYDASGHLELSFFSIALAMAIEKEDPNYWKTNEDFRVFLMWNLKRSEEIFKKTYNNKTYMQENIIFIERIKTNPEAQSMRDFINKNLEGIFLK